MAYERAMNAEALTSDEKRSLWAEYFTHYEREAARDPAALNRKLPRKAFATLLDRIRWIPRAPQLDAAFD